MQANAGLVAGSYNRNELVRIRHDTETGVSNGLNFLIVARSDFLFRSYCFIDFMINIYGKSIVL